ncbi:MAG: DUF2520 domain-containing protein [Myxococcota bacterium]
MQVALVGRGRLGRTLEVLLPRVGHRTEGVGRDRPVPPCDVVLLCVPDAAVAAVAASIPIGPVVLHCAGALDLSVLAPHHRIGSLHPLMTFPGPEIAVPDLRGAPAAVAGTEEARAIATGLARDLGMDPFEVPGDRRLYHAAAVMAGNLVTVLVHEAAQVLVEAGVSPEKAAPILIPLALRSAENARHGLAALTGPVARGDTATLDAHLAAMRDHGLETTRALYDLLLKHALGRRTADDRNR